MKYVKTFEELWPFKEESSIEKNKKSLVDICKYLIDNFHKKKICDYYIKRVEVGYSKDIFIIQFSTDTPDIIRFYWKINSEYQIIDFQYYYIKREDKLLVHYYKHKTDRPNVETYLELDEMVVLMKKYFKERHLLEGS